MNDLRLSLESDNVTIPFSAGNADSISSLDFGTEKRVFNSNVISNGQVSGQNAPIVVQLDQILHFGPPDNPTDLESTLIAKISYIPATGKERASRYINLTSRGVRFPFNGAGFEIDVWNVGNENGTNNDIELNITATIAGFVGENPVRIHRASYSLFSSITNVPLVPPGATQAYVRPPVDSFWFWTRSGSLSTEHPLFLPANQRSVIDVASRGSTYIIQPAASLDGQDYTFDVYWEIGN